MIGHRGAIGIGGHKKRGAPQRAGRDPVFPVTGLGLIAEHRDPVHACLTGLRVALKGEGAFGHSAAGEPCDADRVGAQVVAQQRVEDGRIGAQRGRKGCVIQCQRAVAFRLDADLRQMHVAGPKTPCDQGRDHPDGIKRHRIPAQGRFAAIGHGCAACHFINQPAGCVDDIHETLHDRQRAFGIGVHGDIGRLGRHRLQGQRHTGQQIGDLVRRAGDSNAVQSQFGVLGLLHLHGRRIAAEVELGKTAAGRGAETQGIVAAGLGYHPQGKGAVAQIHHPRVDPFQCIKLRGNRGKRAVRSKIQRLCRCGRRVENGRISVAPTSGFNGQSTTAHRLVRTGKAAKTQNLGRGKAVNRDTGRGRVKCRRIGQGHRDGRVVTADIAR